MYPPAEFEFVVGETYENEKGLFTVMSIEKSDMVIRWASGEEARTSIQFQDRIQRRRQWEKQMREAKAAAKPAPPKAAGARRRKQAPPEP
ncbi:MAG: hypothetical protein MUD16_04575 [Desulfobacterales bacterium]|jgi:uncharacterized Zn finger protein|nr:hypothetical protein [Desulfobacterales bacterium]